MKTVFIIDTIKKESLKYIKEAIYQAYSKTDPIETEDLCFLLVDTTEPRVLNFCYNYLESLGLDLLTRFPEEEFYGKSLCYVNA